MTPFAPDGSLDEAAFRALVEWQIAEGSAALVACGTTGEAATLTQDEQFTVVRWCVEQARGRVPVIAGAGSNDTRVARANLAAAKAAGADAVSVLTDEPFFQGHLDHIRAVRDAVDLPVLRKDFILDETQIYEASVAGADAILLIVAALEQDQLEYLHDVATTCQLDVLVEVHTLEEMDRALATDARIIGINNRNLVTFEVDLAVSESLSEQVPPGIILVSESGIRTAEDSRRLRACGAEAILVGEALMRSPDVARQAAELKLVNASETDGAPVELN